MDGSDDIEDDLPDLVTVVIGEDPPDRLDKALARDVPEGMGLSRSRLGKLITAGAVRRGDQVLGEPKIRVAAGDVIDIAVPPPTPMSALPQPIPLDILHQDAELLVVNKPAGMVVHPAPGTADGTLVNALLHHCGATLSGLGGDWRPGIVHRIDKDTSGLLVVAKTDRAHQHLAAQFAAHTIQRRYLALCHGVPGVADPRLLGLAGVSVEPGGLIRIATELARHRHDRQRQAVVASGGRRAVTRLKVLKGFGMPPQVSLCEFRLETGRTHQIRVHAAHIGHGLVGDPVYGGQRRPSANALPAGAAAALADFPRQALHAVSLGFIHPVSGQRLDFEAGLPDDMIRLLDNLSAA